MRETADRGKQAGNPALVQREGGKERGREGESSGTLSDKVKREKGKPVMVKGNLHMGMCVSLKTHRWLADYQGTRSGRWGLPEGV